MVTAELALGLPVLLAVTLALVWAVSLGLAQVRAVDAAREAARLLARGDDLATAVSAARQVAPGAVVEVLSRDPVRVRVQVVPPAPGGPAGRLLQGVSPVLESTATAVAEETS